MPKIRGHFSPSLFVESVPGLAELQDSLVPSDCTLHQAIDDYSAPAAALFQRKVPFINESITKLSEPALRHARQKLHATHRGRVQSPVVVEIHLLLYKNVRISDLKSKNQIRGVHHFTLATRKRLEPIVVALPVGLQERFYLLCAVPLTRFIPLFKLGVLGSGVSDALKRLLVVVFCAK